MIAVKSISKKKDSYMPCIAIATTNKLLGEGRKNGGKFPLLMALGRIRGITYDTRASKKSRTFLMLVRHR